LAKKKLERAARVEQELRRRGVRTRDVIEKSLRSRIASGALEIPLSLREKMKSLAVDQAKLIPAHNIEDPSMSSALYASPDDRLEPVAYDKESGELLPFQVVDSFYVPCCAIYEDRVADPAVIEIMPVTDIIAADGYRDAGMLLDILPSPLLLPIEIREALASLAGPERSALGEGLGVLRNEKLWVIQTCDHACSELFFKYKDIYGSQLSDARLVKIRAGAYESDTVAGSNEIAVTDVHRILAL